ncbi:MAG TPA: hypothetical protein VF624_15040 [Tepidisphaeraceae bacterium]|jgi:hypothetical protein
MLYTIKTPNVGYTGIREGIAIIDGVGKTENRTVARELQQLGYTVEPDPTKPSKETEAAGK